MNLLKTLYEKSLLENDKHVRFWEDYLQNLKNLDFTVYAEKLKVPILVPIGSRILFRGELKHTSEVTVSLGADYFVKCSLKQAEVLRQHRIKGAQEKLNLYKKERDYLRNQTPFNKQNIFKDSGQEIVEEYSEEEDKAWRTKHRENVRQYKQGKAKEETQEKEEMTKEELWNRLEELEIQEELEEEYLSMRSEAQRSDLLDSDEEDRDSNNSFIIKDDEEIMDKERTVTLSEAIEKSMKIRDNNETLQQNPKFVLLQQVLDKQNELENKLLEMKLREKSQSKNEKDLIAKLDEMEELDELEDEMDRLDDKLQNEDIEETDTEELTKVLKLERRVSFADEVDSETLELKIKHSDVETNNEPYNQEKGILKPSDIYEAFPNLFDNATTSILKKSKYDNKTLLKTHGNPTKFHDKTSKDSENASKSSKLQFQDEDQVENRTIVINDIVEKVDMSDNKEDTIKRPVSLFKMKRLQKKS